MSLTERESGAILERLDVIKELLKTMQENNERQDIEIQKLSVRLTALEKELSEYRQYAEKLASKTYTWLALIISVSSLLLTVIIKLGVK